SGQHRARILRSAFVVERSGVVRPRTILSPGTDRYALAPRGQATGGSWTCHHGDVGARLHRRQWWPGGAAGTVLVLVYVLCGVSDASGSSTVVGTPTHPQILTCAEEATQFIGTVPPIGPHDIGFGPGYFPQARRLATANPPNSKRLAQPTGY